MRFSQRMGITPATVQPETMTADLRSGLWHVIDSLVLQPAYHEWAQHRMSPTPFGRFQPFLSDLWANELGLPREKMGKRFPPIKKQLQSWYFNEAEWFQIYDLLEFILRADPAIDEDDFRSDINTLLDRERSAYRLVGERVVAVEGDTPAPRIDAAAGSPLGQVQQALDSAGKHLNNTDYAASMSDSVRAVQHMLDLLAGELDELPFELPAALRGTIAALRQRPEAAPHHEDAHFYLSAATLLVNTLIIKAQRAKIDL